MTRFPIAVALALIGVLPVVAQQAPDAPQAPQAPEDPLVFRSGAEFVSVSVTVTDRRGRLVTDLTQDDFVVLEDGRQQRIANFQSVKDSVPVGIGMGLLVDVSGSMNPDKLATMRIGINRMMSRMKKEDEFYLMEFAIAPELVVPWTTNRNDVLNTVRRIKTRPGTAIYDSILAALPVSASGEKKKQVILVMSDGSDYNSKTPRSQVAQAAFASDILVYAVVMDGEEGFGARSNANLRQGAAELSQVTDPTGGSTHYVQGFQQLEDVLDSLGREVSQQYFLEYQRDGTKDGQFHTIVVRVNREDVVVRHRRGYVAD